MNQNVLKTAEMLNMLNVLGELEERGGLAKFSPEHSTYSTFPLTGTHFLSNVLLSGDMFNMLNPGGGMLNQNVLKTAEMLNMLNMLNVFGRARRKGGVWQSSPQNIQHIQHIQHFP